MSHYDNVLGKRVSDIKPSPTKNLYYPSGRRRKRKNKRYSIPLPDNWDELRMAVIERDGVCQDCGNKEWLGIHHQDLNRLNNELDNLILLCWTCHMKKHHSPSITK